MPASLDDILTAAKNLVVATNGVAGAIRDSAQAIRDYTQAYLGVNGTQTMFVDNSEVVKVGPGRVCSVSVIATSTNSGTIYDDVTLVSPQNPIFTVAKVTGVYVIDMPVKNGIVVVTGAGQTFMVSYS